AAYAALLRRWPQPGGLCVFCGSGNNGGDGYLIARLALAGGWRVRLFALSDPKPEQADAVRARGAFETAGGRVERPTDAPIDADVIVDALLGTGLGRDVAGGHARAIECINAAHAAGSGVLAVDVPSGIDATTGHRWGTAVHADLTATFIAPKAGLFTGAGAGHSGAIVFDDLGAPRELYAGVAPFARGMTDSLRLPALAPRLADAHKGDHGHVLCVGGNQGLGGAVRMTAEAGLRCGAGLVSVACHPHHAAAMSQARPELMCRGIPPDQTPPQLFAQAHVVAVGPGLGGDDWARGLLRRALECAAPLVVDADALNLLAGAPQARGNWILTPHPGEAARLLATDTATINADRPAAVQALARQYQAVVVLKGAGTLVAVPDGLWLCTAGNPGMAGGGMGDLLTGIIAGLVAQGHSLATAAVLGVWLHARAADRVAAARGERGMLATDL